MFEETISIFTEQLDGILKSAETHLKKAEKGIPLCNKTLSTLQNIVEKEDFEDKTAEIDFFRNIKPYPMSYLIYFTEVRSCELSIPKAGNNFKVRFLEKEIKKINKFFTQNNDFVNYMEQDYNYLDHQYFTRRFRNDFPFVPTINYYQYPEFSTSHDMTWAMVQALYRYIHYIRENLQRLQTGNIALYAPKQHKVILWSGAKTALVELIYALYASGNINHGAVDLATVTSCFEDFFNIKLDNVYKIYSEIKARKGSKTKFLEELSIILQQKINADDSL
ncbi:RteC domain-containing protein [Zunongwangia sp. H14]|uniref:RteC domain-containing protein n=1 Tax=Zunongwangia sp. H14 TaxID=3240792 RepID=UPI0035648758